MYELCFNQIIWNLYLLFHNVECTAGKKVNAVAACVAFQRPITFLNDTILFVVENVSHKILFWNYLQLLHKCKREVLSFTNILISFSLCHFLKKINKSITCNYETTLCLTQFKMFSGHKNVTFYE